MKAVTYSDIAGLKIFFLHTIFLKMFGIFPKKIEGSKWIYLSHFCGIFICTAAILQIIFTLMYMPEAFNSQNYAKLALGMNYVTVAVSCLHKYYLLKTKHAIFQRLGEWSIIAKNTHKKNNVKKHIAEKVVALVNSSFYFTVVVAGINWIAWPFIIGSGSAMPSKLPKSWNPFLFPIQIMIIVFFVTTVVYAVVSVGHAVALLCTEVAYISQRMRELKYDSNHPSEFNENLILCIQEHTNSFRILHDITKIHSGMFSYQVFIAISTCCILIFGVLKKGVVSKAIFYILPNSLATIPEFFLLCWVGEEITHEFQNIHWCIYDNNWYEAPPAVRRQLRMVLEISKSPIHMKGAKVFKASLSTFVEAMKQSFSLYTVLKAVTGDD